VTLSITKGKSGSFAICKIKGPGVVDSDLDVEVVVGLQGNSNGLEGEQGQGGL
jgi:hypothetical protein